MSPGLAKEKRRKIKEVLFYHYRTGCCLPYFHFLNIEGISHFSVECREQEASLT